MISNCPVLFLAPGTHCTDIPVPTVGTDMEQVNWNGDPVPIGGVISYRCRADKKFQFSLGLAELNATCLDNNQWDVPTWRQCIESKSSNKLRKFGPVSL